MISEKTEGFNKDEVQQNKFIEEIVKFYLKATTTTYNTTIDYDFMLFDKFLQGFKATVFAPNVMSCSATLQTMMDAYNQTIIYFQNPAEPGAYSPYIFNLTHLISGVTANAEGECYTTGWSIYQYILFRKS